jgi:hypothetical protein
LLLTPEGKSKIHFNLRLLIYDLRLLLTPEGKSKIKNQKSPCGKSTIKNPLLSGGKSKIKNQKSKIPLW